MRLPPSQFLWGLDVSYQVMEDRCSSSDVLLVIVPGDHGRSLLPLLILQLLVQLRYAGVLVFLFSHGEVEALIDEAVLLDVRLLRKCGAAAKYILLLALLLFNSPRSLTLCWRPLKISNKYST